MTDRQIFRAHFSKVVRETIEGLDMLQSGDRVLVAVSGGADSVALLHCLLELAPVFKIQLGVAHLNHGLRPGFADRDAEFVGKLANRMNLPVFIRQVDVQGRRIEMKRSLEDTARIVRYEFLQAVADTHRFDKIAVGHHADDNAEVVLMHLIRGSGSSGLGGMPAVRRDRIIRPLIRLRRGDILTYLQSKQIFHVADESNTDARFLRNRVRHQLMPLLENAFNPKIVDALNRTAAIRRSEEDWIESISEEAFQHCLIESKEDQPVLSVRLLGRQPLPLLRRLIRKAVANVQGNLSRIGYLHVESVVKLVRHGPPNASLALPNAIRVDRRYNRLSVRQVDGATRSEVPSENRPYAYRVPLPDSGPVVIDVTEAALRLRFERYGSNMPTDLPPAGQFVVFFDMDKLSFPLLLRNVNPGDRFQPCGMAGHQKVKKYFIDHKVPPAARRVCPVLLSDGNPIWLVGHRLGEPGKADPSSRRILKAEMLLA